MPDDSKKMWEVLLEEHHLLSLPNSDSKSPSLEDKKKFIIKTAEKCAESDRDAVCLAEVYRLIHDYARPQKSAVRGMRALCLSGGGIRSATFNLGLIQGLARKRKLRLFDYLSTVSGGGFIGSWLSVWSHRTPEGITGVEGILEHGRLPRDAKDFIDPRQLSGRRLDLASEPQEVSHLREFSNYLTPRLGFFSGDTWTLIATYPRNLLLNWLVIVPLVVSCIFLLWSLVLSGYALNAWSLPSGTGIPTTAYQLVRISGLILMLLGIAFAVALAPRGDGDRSPNFAAPRNSPPRVNVGWVTYLPLLVGILLLTMVTPSLPKVVDVRLTAVVGTLASFLAVNEVLVVVALFARKLRGSHSEMTFDRQVRDFFKLSVVINLCSLAPMLLLMTLIRHVSTDPGQWSTLFWLSSVARVGVMFLWFTLIVGLLGEKSSPEFENGREWWARLTGLLLRFGTLYFLLYGVVIVIPYWFERWARAQHPQGFAASISAAVVATLSAIYATKAGGRTSNLGNIRNINPALYPLPRRHFATIAACVFLVLTLLALSSGARLVVEYIVARYPGVYAAPDSGIGPNTPWPDVWRDVAKMFGAAAGLFAIGLVLSWPININRFSLGGTYRSRLIRAYLGASRGAARDPDPFTGFDAQDNVPLHFLRRNCAFTVNDLVDPHTLAAVLCHQQGDFFDCVRSQPLLRDPARFARLATYAKSGGNKIAETKDEIAAALNEFLLVPELFTETFKNVSPDAIDVEILRAHERVEADGSVRLRNRLIIEQQLNSTGDWLVKSFTARPFHVINATLNLVGGKRLAWQQRKAKSFVFTPLYCGFDNGYRSTAMYADGITVGGAMTVSGAAASPNMGYHSSSLLTIIMMLFNVRLGSWLGNPAGATGKGKFGIIRDALLKPFRPTWCLPSPRFSFRSYVDEAFGRTTETNPYVYVSDGGHFDNLGLYEMVRRRCHFIVVSDASADHERAFTDFGNAIQKIRIDLGVRITIDQEHETFLQSSDDGKQRPHRIVKCTIHYKKTDRFANGVKGVNGTLIYLKPALANKEPPDLYTYGRESKTFPHESTADQWFSEAQFECYRLLGELMAKEIPWDDPGGPGDAKDISPERFKRDRTTTHDGASASTTRH